MIHNVISPIDLFRSFSRGRWQLLRGGRFFIAFMLFGLMLLHPHTGLAQKMYWTNQNFPPKIQRANLDGAGVEDLVTGLSIPLGIALDVAAGKMYWVEGGTVSDDKIQRANLDGSSVEDLVTGLGDPLGIALDLAAGKMYWTEASAQKIQRANLDGTGVEDLVTGLDLPFGIALDVAAGKMYWTDFGTDKIQRANLDGSSVEDLVTTGLDVPEGIALDLAAGKMYWVDFTTGKIQRANLDGSSVEDLVTGLSNPSAIALDVAAGKMYWSEAGSSSIKRTDLNGANIETLVTGPGVRVGLALDLSAPDFVLLADKRIEFKAHNFSEGAIHSNDDIKFSKGNPSTHTGNASAVDDVEIREKNTVFGDVKAGGSIKLYGNADITGAADENAAVANIPLPALPAFTFGSTDVNVPQNTVYPLAPGNYRNVKVQKNATLEISSGTYNIKRLDMSNGSIFLKVIAAVGEVIVNIDNNLDVNKDVEMQLASGSSEDVTFNVKGSAVKFRDRVIWFGNLLAPNANVSLGKEVYYKGTISAKQIELLKNAVAVPHGSTTPIPKVFAGYGEDEEGDSEILNLPTEYTLDQNYPNPFNPTTTIRFALPEASNVSLKIFNIRGQLVRTLASGNLEAGIHNIHWDATDDVGQKVASGFYFYQLLSRDFQQVKKMLLLK